MNLRFVQSFVATADLGSFSKAAEALFVTQAAIAARVAKLEEELGVQLFVREGSTLRLTDQGRKALAAAKKLAEQADVFLQQVRDPALTQGLLRIGWTGFVSHLLQPELTLELQRRYPLLNVEFQTLSSLDVLDLLAEGRIDLAFCVGAHARRGWLDVPMFELPLRWVCGPGLFESGRPVTLSDIASRPILTYPTGTIPHQAMLQQLQQLGAGLPVMHSLNTLSETIELVCAGAGSTLLPPLVVWRELQSGAMRLLEAESSIASLSFHAAMLEHGSGGVCSEVCTLARELADARLAQLPAQA
jgi:DNA-binding transcriptional LysR family regulator